MLDARRQMKFLTVLNTVPMNSGETVESDKIAFVISSKEALIEFS